jgi:PAS domain S-box-containing protein
VALIDEADALARDDALPIDPSLPEVAACRSWLHGEIVGQLRGARPTRWALPDALEPVQQPATIDSDALMALRAMRIGVIVVDDANRITFVNDAAAELLGWRAEDLAHRRLTAIIPPETREAHLAGFSRYTLTGEARILGRTIRVQALCRNGARIDVDLRIDALPKVHGRRSFKGEISSRP